MIGNAGPARRCRQRSAVARHHAKWHETCFALLFCIHLCFNSRTRIGWLKGLQYFEFGRKRYFRRKRTFYSLSFQVKAPDRLEEFTTTRNEAEKLKAKWATAKKNEVLSSTPTPHRESSTDITFFPKKQAAAEKARQRLDRALGGDDSVPFESKQSVSAKAKAASTVPVDEKQGGSGAKNEQSVEADDNQRQRIADAEKAKQDAAQKEAAEKLAQEQEKIRVEAERKIEKERAQELARLEAQRKAEEEKAQQARLDAQRKKEEAAAAQRKADEQKQKVAEKQAQSLEEH